MILIVSIKTIVNIVYTTVFMYYSVLFYWPVMILFDIQYSIIVKKWDNKMIAEKKNVILSMIFLFNIIQYSYLMCI